MQIVSWSSSPLTVCPVAEPLLQYASPHAQDDGPALMVIHGVITLNTEALNIEWQLNAY